VAFWCIGRFVVLKFVSFMFMGCRMAGSDDPDVAEFMRARLLLNSWF